VASAEEQRDIRLHRDFHVLSALRRMLTGRSQNENGYVLEFFAEITVRAVYWIQEENFQFSEDIQTRVGTQNPNPSSYMDLLFQRFFKQLNVATLSRALLCFALEIVREYSIHQEMGWRMHQWLLQAAVAATHGDNRCPATSEAVFDVIED
jgi:hypothetical protein